MRYYAGIGSRETPFDIQLMMYDLAAKLGNKFVLRSGHAIGADQAFELGCDSVKGMKEIFVANDCNPEAMKYSSQFHPAWDKCKPGARKLHGRNAMILLGEDLKSPVERVIGWCIENDNVWEGGTGQGFRIAKANNIPIYNLYLPEVKKRFMDFIYWGNK